MELIHFKLHFINGLHLIAVMHEHSHVRPSTTPPKQYYDLICLRIVFVNRVLETKKTNEE